MQKFNVLMDRLSHSYGIHQVFSDFLTLCICAFSFGEREDEYFATIRKYEKPEAYQMSEALAALVIEMTGDGSGLVDVLGTFFEENINYGRNGQFFTPQPICDMMAQIQYSGKMLERIIDPACGSGRLLLAAAKKNRSALFYGADIDGICAKMTTINLCLNGLFGEVAWMNSLTNQYFGGWQIYPGKKGVPTIRTIQQEQSQIHLKLPKNQKLVKIKKQQQLLFEL